MWPSEKWASSLYDLANWGLIIGLIIGVISTVLVFWMGDIKERYLRVDLAVTKERAVNAETIAEKERLAREKLDERLAGWQLDPEAQKRLIEALKPFAGTPYDLSVNASEAMFMEVLDHLLTAAGWSRKRPKAGASTQPGFTTVLLLMHDKASINALPGMRVAVAHERMKDFGGAAEILVDGLINGGIPTQAFDTPQDPNPTAVHIIIGKRE